MSTTDDRPVPVADVTPTELDAYSPEQLRLIKTQVMSQPRNREVSDDELAYFLAVARATGLDPLTSRDIYAIFRFNGQSRREEMKIQVGIDALRKRAQRTGQFAGRQGPWWCGPDGEWKEVWAEGTAPTAAKVTVTKAIGGLLVDTPAVVHWAEYVQRDKAGKAAGMWKTMPRNQLAKCAEAQALRAAFPDELGALVIDSEMDQADSAGPRPALPEPRPASADATVVDGTAEAVPGVDLHELATNICVVLTALGTSVEEANALLAEAHGSEKRMTALYLDSLERLNNKTRGGTA